MIIRRTILLAALWVTALWFPFTGWDRLGAQVPAQSSHGLLVADAGGPYRAIAGREVTLSAVRSTGPDGDDLAFAWDLGSGRSTSGPSPNVTYAAAGIYPVTLLVTNGKGLLATAATHVVVMNSATPNQPPSATALRVNTAFVNEFMTFDASSSRDPDGDPVACAWTFGDGASASGPTVTHAYARPGAYPVRVLATDGKGGAATATLAAVVVPAGYGAGANRKPEVRVTAPDQAFAGQLIVFDGNGSSDPDGDNLTFTWIFDDGEPATGVTASHVFASPAYHVVVLVASDGRGGVATASVTVDVGREKDNLYPVADTGGPYTGVVKLPVAFKAKASDADGDELTFFWDFGDGTQGPGEAPAHAYAKAGTYSVKLLVSDGNGDVTTASTTVTVSPPRGPANQPPAANAGGPYTGGAGKAVTLDARVSSDRDKDTLEYAWAFGDGTTGAGATVSHIYDKPGTYAVMLLVTDGKGGSGSALATAVIRDQ